MSPNPLRRLVLAGVASAALAGGAVSAATAAPSAPAPVPADAFTEVTSQIAIHDAAGAVVERRACTWTDPQPDDRPCLAFAGDPRSAIRAIEEAGGVSATRHVVSADLETFQRIGRRADGTWLLRSRDVHHGRRTQFGFVCSADGERCRTWDAGRSASAAAAVRDAAARLRG